MKGFWQIQFLQKSVDLVLWMREKEQALQLPSTALRERSEGHLRSARVNLIGEHTDHTGLVMPMAIYGGI
jgi:galactokinase